MQGRSCVSEEPGIVFSVKELIGRLDGKLDTITNILTSKADRSDVIALEHRVGQVEDKVNVMHQAAETRQINEMDHTVTKRWVVTTWISIGVALIAIAGIVVEAVIK
jgi:hypothetical protein